MFSQRRKPNSEGIKQLTLNNRHSPKVRQFSVVKQNNEQQQGSPKVRGMTKPKSKSNESTRRGRNPNRSPSKRTAFSTSPNKKRSSRAKSQDNRRSAKSSHPNKWKTELCRAFMEGRCRHGDDCLFAHGEEDLRVVERPKKWKTELCNKFHSVGQCPYGSRCRFIHLETGFAQELFRPRPRSVKRLPVFDDLCTPASDDENELAGVTPNTTGKTLMMMDLRHSRNKKIQQVERRNVPRGLFDRFLRPSNDDDDSDVKENITQNIAPKQDHPNTDNDDENLVESDQFHEWLQTELFDMVMAAVVDKQQLVEDQDAQTLISPRF